MGNTPSNPAFLAGTQRLNVLSRIGDSRKVPPQYAPPNSALERTSARRSVSLFCTSCAGPKPLSSKPLGGAGDLVIPLLVLVAAHAVVRPPVSFAIRLDAPVITRGESPVFRVLLRNTTDHPIRIMDAKRGGGLQRWYYKPLVTRGGRAVDIIAAIDDPASPAESDYITLQPHATYGFHLSEFSESWDQLKPGIYKVRIRFHHYRHGEGSYTLESNVVKLQIKEKRVLQLAPAADATSFAATFPFEQRVLLSLRREGPRRWGAGPLDG